MMKLLPTRLKLRLHLAAVLFAALIGHGYAQNPLTNGLVAYYPFNGNANDMSGNGNNGAVQGATLGEDRHGNANSAFIFNGVDSRITVPDSPSLRIPNDITVVCWLRFTSAPAKPIRLVGKGDDSNRNYGLWYMATTGPEPFWMFAQWPPQGGGGLQQNTTSFVGALAIGKWYQAVGVRSGSKARLYVDGILLAETSTVSASTYTGGQPLTLGAGHDLTDTRLQAMNGLLDDVRIYNRALSASEVTNLYVTESTVTTLNLYPVLTIAGVVGGAYRIEATSDLVNTNVWTTLTNLTLPSSPYDFMDKSTPQPLRRFYRAFPVP